VFLYDLLKGGNCLFERRLGRPVPFNRQYVSISGFLTDVIYKQNSEPVVERFTVSVHHIAFLGQKGNLTAIPNTLDSRCY
jgi:hypothetical protein